MERLDNLEAINELSKHFLLGIDVYKDSGRWIIGQTKACLCCDEPFAEGATLPEAIRAARSKLLQYHLAEGVGLTPS